MQLVLIVVAVIVLWYLFSGSGSAKRENISYPFFPIDPMNVNPFETQAVFGQPDYLFQFSHSPETAQYGAYQALQAAQNLAYLDRKLGIEWQTNQGFNPTGNTEYDLLLSSEEIGAWRNL